MVEKDRTETGLPTQQAIENGLVKRYYEDEDCHLMSSSESIQFLKSIWRSYYFNTSMVIKSTGRFERKS